MSTSSNQMLVLNIIFSLKNKNKKRIIFKEKFLGEVGNSRTGTGAHVK